MALGDDGHLLTSPHRMDSDVIPTSSVHHAPLRTRMIQGAGIVVGFTAINLLIRGGDLNAPAWLLIAVFAGLVVCGAAGGATYYATDSLRLRGGWRRTLANVASLLCYGLLAFGMLSLGLYFG